ncbi:YSC84-related protein [Pseudoalteromonas luteoviolacea]|uniref:Ysc84 actin-binding domain-containing protein n=1 Tax=Pseudoalteromonas luteoviolacea H33 TaxID=1365251 RepID=A0A167DTK9_9GAMM|nr:YSC84-related protein [Pseudoalteromonas luteoviolacea]KZN49335.1 hypothetical protein N476_20000 [Pseudoalteromonas luteoviolacea H33]KZN74861.1 hypothetical protein N477_20785 [Pseudoalteromonas luteoviolacea H33-S]MBQ4878310.1 hypothetical protein [Pseudoalteromonas luteoviolacea]MBQ4907465.1 hypothetical protein [Pseudoalteromonas luteoviolacea]
MKRLFVMGLILSITYLSGCASMGSGDNAQKRAQIIKMKNDTLSQLYKEKPDTRAQLRSAVGYAVFSNANINLLLVSAGTGYGVVKNSQTGQFTYMNMAEGGVGLGLGVKDYRLILVFHTTEALNDFVSNGWTFGGNADAAAKASDKGAAIQGEVYYGGMSVYTLTQSGLALQATVKGTRFWPDSSLN